MKTFGRVGATVMWGVGACVAGILAPPASGRLPDSEIALTCQWLGVGGVVRPGEWAGIRVGINDSSRRQRDVVVRLAVPDPDGDVALYQRRTTTNPGLTVPLWLYAPIPATGDGRVVLTVSVHAADESPADALHAGERLGSLQLPTPNAIGLTEGLIGIASVHAMGLRRYEGVEGVAWLPGGHERTRVVTGLAPEHLPDRWLGLAPFSVIVWREPPPAGLTSERAQALREWVMRGGHLVVVLPRVGQTWTDAASNPLYDLVPRVRIRRLEHVDLTPYAPLLTRAAGATLPTDQVLHLFEPVPGAAGHEAIGVLPVLSSSDSAPLAPSNHPAPWIVARRLVGTGVVSLVGLDLGTRELEQRGLPDTELFWHRVLGRRGDLTTPQPAAPFAIRMRDPVTLDAAIPDLIALEGYAAGGVLLGAAVFVLYWTLAGPGGFALLKRLGRLHHAWLVFLAVAGAFTAASWGLALALRPARLVARHLTLVDHIHGQGIQRARAWISLLVPWHGSATVQAGEPTVASRLGLHDALAPFASPDNPGGTFPDARAYAVRAADPAQVTFPARATVKSWRVDWAGPSPWTFPHPVDWVAGVRQAPPRTPWLLEGELVHRLPGPLTDLVLFVALGLKPLTPDLAGAAPADSLIADGAAFKLDTWPPHVPLNLSRTTRLDQADHVRISAATYLADLLARGRIDVERLPPPAGVLTERLTAVAFFPHLEPPDTRSDVRLISRQRLAQRWYTHGWDLGAWLTQPCLIIVGHLGTAHDAPTPIPLYAGRSTPAPIPSEGRTVVRCVIPLSTPPDPSDPHVTPEPARKSPPWP